MAIGWLAPCRCPACLGARQAAALHCLRLLSVLGCSIPPALPLPALPRVLCAPARSLLLAGARQARRAFRPLKCGLPGQVGRRKRFPAVRALAAGPRKLAYTHSCVCCSLPAFAACGACFQCAPQVSAACCDTPCPSPPPSLRESRRSFSPAAPCVRCGLPPRASSTTLWCAARVPAPSPCARA
jgi:hypothetical protein